MEVSLDGILNVITIIYKSVESYNQNSEQLEKLIYKIKLFELPLQKLKASNHIDPSMCAYIDNLYHLMNEISEYLYEFEKKSKIRKFFSALITDEKIKEFNDRIDAIKKDLNFEFDLNNHLIFHSFNSRNHQFSHNVENLLYEIKNQKKIKDVDLSELIEELVEQRMSCYQMQFEYKLYEMQKSLHEQQIKFESEIKSNLQEKINSSQNCHSESSNRIENELEKKEKKENLCVSPIGYFCDLLEKNANNINLKKHFELILLLLLQDKNKGYFIFTENSIIKSNYYKNENGVADFKVCLSKISEKINKIFKVFVPVDLIDCFLFKNGFAFLISEYLNQTDKCIFEIKEFYTLISL